MYTILGTAESSDLNERNRTRSYKNFKSDSYKQRRKNMNKERQNPQDGKLRPQKNTKIEVKL